LDNNNVVQEIMNGNKLPKPSNCPPLLYDLMLRCWDLSAESRPSFAQLLDELQKLHKAVGRTIVALPTEPQLLVQGEYTTETSLSNNNEPKRASRALKLRQSELAEELDDISKKRYSTFSE